MRRCCCFEEIYGPRDDDYGRDKLIEDWVCPQCREITQFSHWAKMISDRLDKLPRRKDDV